jgi:hypothetical protein
MSNCKINVPYGSSDECLYAERRYARRRGAAESGCYRRTHKRSLKMLFLQSQKKLDDGKKNREKAAILSGKVVSSATPPSTTTSTKISFLSVVNTILTVWECPQEVH